MRITQTSFLDDQEQKIISQDEINSILWKACDTFRGPVDPSEYKNYILVMLFVKYLSDMWRAHAEEYQQKNQGDLKDIRRRVAKERIHVPHETAYHDLYPQRHP